MEMKKRDKQADSIYQFNFQLFQLSERDKKSDLQSA
jgi:hypothetical protein